MTELDSVHSGNEIEMGAQSLKWIRWLCIIMHRSQTHTIEPQSARCRIMYHSILYICTLRKATPSNLCMLVCACVCMCAQVCACVHKCAHACACACACVRTCVYKCACVCACVRKCMCMCAHACARVRALYACMRAHACVHVCACVRKCVRVYMCVYNMGGKYTHQIPITNAKGKGQFELSKCFIIFSKKMKPSKCGHLLNSGSGSTSVCFVPFCTFPKCFFFFYVKDKLV